MTMREMKSKLLISRADRHPYDDYVNVTLFGSRELIKVKCLNVSASGFAFVEKMSKIPYTINSVIELHIFSLDKDQILKLTGKIVRIDPAGDQGDRCQYGVQFSFLDVNELKVWHDFILMLKESYETES